MNLRTLDLNLLRAFASIYVERNVSAAARREALSQPAMSNALNRLRRSFDDELFVKTPRGMEPTVLANQLIKPVNEALTILKNGLDQQQKFNPMTAVRCFRMLMSDAGESAMLPSLMRGASELSGQLTFEAVKMAHDKYAEALQSGAVDLAIGNLPFLNAGFERSHLFDDPYCIVAREDNPLLEDSLTLKSFLSASHIAVTTGKADALVDQHLSRKRLKRNIRLVVSNYHVAVDVVAGSDLLATVPQMIARSAKGVSMKALPMKIPRAAVLMVWHSVVHRDPASLWLRQTLLQQFGDRPAKG
ncbi:LysR family transcriptional regulator [Variovorax saccharolyticus]|uniref:LysR family transcriptional regulator n=1 Tax=Variovorax saccharolyticus TaxID=3053516 RepID=UPI002575FD23|nr:LysR family transcriptional regulator [Variovorax sp. J22R187]MDM0021784.1 LysR family transcriptional regulator [Variovorax sp. J22R187]